MKIDYELWHRHVALLRPPGCQLPQDDKKIVVAILKHLHVPNYRNLAEDFLWVNCKYRAERDNLLTAYQGRNPAADQIVLCHAGIPWNSSLRLREIDTHNVPGIVVLEAALEVNIPQRILQGSLGNGAENSSATSAPNAAQIKSERAPLTSVSANPQPAEHVDINKTAAVAKNPVPVVKTQPTQKSVFAAPIPSSATRSTTGAIGNTASQVRFGQPSLGPTSVSKLLPNAKAQVSQPPPASSTVSKIGLIKVPSQQPTPSSSVTKKASPKPPAPQLPSQPSPNQKKTPIQVPSQQAVQSPPSSQPIPISELPSQRLPDQSINQPFLLYLNHFYENSPSIRSLPLPALVDHVWSKWQAMPDKASERVYFMKPIQNAIRDGQRNSEDAEKALKDIKPEVPHDVNSSQAEGTSLLLDFKAEFDEADTTDTQMLKPKQSNFKVQDLMAGATLEELETFVTRGVRWLDVIKGPLSIHKNTSKEAANYLKLCSQIEGYAARTKTVIGVVGNTGAGKSSVINALLEQEQLLPTNTMRACTAVVTEIAYNFEEAGRAYRAEIEFIDEKSWHDELGILFSDLLNSEGKLVREATTPDSDAGIAYAKIRAVYPKKTKDDIARSTIPTLIKEVSHILGRTQKVQEDDSFMFYKRLQKFIDSQEKVSSTKLTEEQRKAPREMEFWPLIKVVRIYCKADALATGAIIVDLPGVHDANAARAAVAEGYMKQCSGLWIVAPIIRAVDDKAAKNLLGQTFKRQLKMDGGFGQVSFICSKTDDISLLEATASLGLDETNGPLWDESDRQAALQVELKNKVKEYNANREAIGETMENLDNQVEAWEELQDKFEEGGEPVYAPVTNKRKSRSRRRSSGGNKRKRLRRQVDDDDDDIESGSEFEDPSDNDEEDDDAEVSIRKPLTLEEIVEQISKLKEQVKNGRKERASLNHQIKNIKDEIQKSIQAQQEAESAIAEHCIKGRNDYSKEAIRQDFAAGVRELDQEKAQEDDEENFDPEKETRDYEEVARSLPVFCVSSRGYQQLTGKRKKDAKVSGFTKLEQTEVPALQKHCKQLTVSGRTAACKKFLTAISQLANSLTIWASSDGTNNHLTPQQRLNEEKFLAHSIGKLDKALDKVVSLIVTNLTAEVTSNVFDKFDVACHSAEARALETSTRWGSRPDPERVIRGGYPWATYKAVCRRNGAYTNARGPIEFNDQLAEPMMMHILAGWERLFARRIPEVFSNLGKNFGQLLNTFHSDISMRSQLSGIGIATLPILEQQLANYQNVFETSSMEAKNSIDQAQREINREFVPAIMLRMTPGYIRCVQESGTGSFMRMKGHMQDHVLGVRDRIFKDSCHGVETALKKVLRTAKEHLENASDEVFEAIERDYRSTFHGIDLKPGEKLPKWQLQMRKSTAKLVEQLEDYLTLDEPPSAIESEADDDDDDAISRQLELESSLDKVKKEEMELLPISNIAGPPKDIKLENEAQALKAADKKSAGSTTFVQYIRPTGSDHESDEDSDEDSEEVMTSSMDEEEEEEEEEESSMDEEEEDPDEEESSEDDGYPNKQAAYAAFYRYMRPECEKDSDSDE